MDTLYAPAYVKAGKLYVRRHAALNERITGWKDGNALVTVERASEPRSLALNKFYWGTVIDISADYHGYLKEEMHEAWKRRLLRTVDPDHRNPRHGSTTRLTDRQMLDYIAQIRAIELEDFNVHIPEPGELVVVRWAA